MVELHSDPALLSALRKAAALGVPAEQARKQKVSYILGAVSDKSNITKERIQEVLSESEDVPA
ncbi:hypothetical protein PhaeoP66_04653 (plasmid) [Phaeobacter inhibens]|uniref:Uncharacterized protein n=1 Tax=Phaeobacter inhibens TaxID=221822 RepID=A0ABM6RLL2_9RHOB|nr:hypothetical protein [Phaeobacter inhibens]AUQ93878.1 hypothetical protein PhaeoP66_01074 [Phaeobacter inhibens]AUQ97379.1 hypothetical protein PhaeoP66_04653 [Phaeobacter inhibens]